MDEQAERSLIALQLDALLAIVAVELTATLHQAAFADAERLRAEHRLRDQRKAIRAALRAAQRSAA